MSVRYLPIRCCCLIESSTWSRSIGILLLRAVQGGGLCPDTIATVSIHSVVSTEAAVIKLLGMVHVHHIPRLLLCQFANQLLQLFHPLHDGIIFYLQQRNGP